MQESLEDYAKAIEVASAHKRKSKLPELDTCVLACGSRPSSPGRELNCLAPVATDRLEWEACW